MNPDTLCAGCMENDSGDPLCPKCGCPFDLEPKNSLQLKPRTMLRDQYLIGRVLGHGGFGITYLAWDIGLESRLAIKEYMPNGVAGRSSGDTKVLAYSEQTKQEFAWGLDRFLEEARVLKKFSDHPGIVSVDTIFRDNGTAYLVMEYLDGVTFEEFLTKRGGKITFETALRIMLPVIDALSAVHSEGVLHRDISPDNIHLTRNGKVKLIDFGAARNALGQKSRNLSIILKEGYAPEEQYRASGIQGPWTDVYATAATLYHSITGQRPQPSLDRQAEDKVRPPRELGVEIDPRAQAALMKALAIRVADRFASMQDFKAALTGDSGVSGATRVIDRNDPRIAAPPPPPPPPARVTATAGRPRWLWPGMLGAAALVSMVLVLNRPVTEKEKSGGGTAGGASSTTSTGGGEGGGGATSGDGSADRSGDKRGSRSGGKTTRSGGGSKTAGSGYSGRRSTGESASSDAAAEGAAGATNFNPRADYDSLTNQADQLARRQSYGQIAPLLTKAIQLDPAKPKAYNMMGELNLYYLNRLPPAIQNYQAAVARGGAATFHVYHDHASGSFSITCKGLLHVSKNAVRYAAFDSVHTFQSSRSEIREMKRNRLVGFITGQRQRSVDLHAFHIRLSNGQNYNFAPASKFTEGERDLILSIMGEE